MASTVNPQALRLAGKVALVTGAGRGIGRAIATLFSLHGAKVVVADVEAERAQATLAEINAAGQCSTAVCDVSDSAQVARMFAEVKTRYGGLDILVNVAGIAGGGKQLDQLDDATWQRMLGVNLSGPFYCTRAAVRIMRERGIAGSIIAISSTGALSGESAVHYDASKGALLAMTRSLARELGSCGIRCNAICPGPTNTELLSALGPEQVASLARRIPLKRIGEPEDVAAAALFLASEEAAFVTGQTLMVNGGSWFL